MDNRERFEARHFQEALETEIERFRGAHVPSGFLILQRLDREVGFIERAQTIAANYDITTEQACFALASALKKSGG